MRYAYAAMGRAYCADSNVDELSLQLYPSRSCTATVIPSL